MSAQTETVAACPGQSEKWNLKTDSVGNPDICGTSVLDSRTEKTCNAGSGVVCSEQETCAEKMSRESSAGHLEMKLREICVRTGQNRNELQKSASDVKPSETNAVKRKRHASTTHPGNHRQLGRKRRKTTDRGGGSHPKFLLGGTIRDPLNLNSLCDEGVSGSVNAATPISSPLPHVNKDPNPAIVPLDVRDPLKLNTVCSETDDSAHLTRTLTPKSGGKKRKKWMDKVCESHSADEATALSKPLKLNLEGLEKQLHHASASKITDKIVSPVIPECGQMYRKRKKQEPTTKTTRALLINTSDTKTKEASPEKKAPPLKERITPEKRKYKRQTSKETKQQLPKFKDENKKFQYGNYHRYYGYRNPDQEDDPRIPFLRKEWFQDKTCLDIGCNSGHLTLYIAKVLEPERISGIDIDATLIGIARKNIRHCLEEERNSKQKKFPVSMEKLYGRIPSSKMLSEPQEAASKFPGNMLFRCANFVPENETLAELQKPEYDTVLCLSVTKWIHLNWGDAGLKRMFRRIFLSLRPGGRFILEPQGWPSYIKKKKLTEIIYKNFKQIQLKPEKFKDYLLSSRVGFSSCETIGTPVNKSKGFRRPILMFTKLTSRAGTSDKPKAKPAQGHTSSETSHRQETPAKTPQVKAPPIGDPAATDATDVTTHDILSSSSVKKLDDSTGLQTENMTIDPCPEMSVVNVAQVAKSDECSDTKAAKFEGLGTEESKNEREVDVKVREEPKLNVRSDELDMCKGNDDESFPPAKKIKTEPTD